MPIYNSDENNILSSLEETYREMLNEKKKRYDGPLTGPDAENKQWPGDEERAEQGDNQAHNSSLDDSMWGAKNERKDKIGISKFRRQEDPEAYDKAMRFKRQKTKEKDKVKPKKGGEAYHKLKADRQERARIRNEPAMYRGRYKRAEKTGERPDAKGAYKSEKDRKRVLKKNKAKLEKDFNFPS